MATSNTYQEEMEDLKFSIEQLEKQLERAENYATIRKIRDRIEIQEIKLSYLKKGYRFCDCENKSQMRLF